MKDRKFRILERIAAIITIFCFTIGVYLTVKRMVGADQGGDELISPMAPFDPEELIPSSPVPPPSPLQSGEELAQPSARMVPLPSSVVQSPPRVTAEPASRIDLPPANGHLAEESPAGLTKPGHDDPGPAEEDRPTLSPSSSIDRGGFPIGLFNDPFVIRMGSSANNSPKTPRSPSLVCTDVIPIDTLLIPSGEKDGVQDPFALAEADEAQLSPTPESPDSENATSADALHSQESTAIESLPEAATDPFAPSMNGDRNGGTGPERESENGFPDEESRGGEKSEGAKAMDPFYSRDLLKSAKDGR